MGMGELDEGWGCGHGQLGEEGRKEKERGYGSGSGKRKRKKRGEEERRRANWTGREEKKVGMKGQKKKSFL